MNKYYIFDYAAQTKFLMVGRTRVQLITLSNDDSKTSLTIENFDLGKDIFGVWQEVSESYFYDTITPRINDFYETHFYPHTQS